LLLLGAGCFAYRDDSNGQVGVAVNVRNNQKSKFRAQSEKDKPLFIVGVVRIIDQ
jgi:hypothetical protein